MEVISHQLSVISARIVMLWLLVAPTSARATDAAAGFGDSIIERDRVTCAVHVPTNTPSGLFVFFGGAYDASEYYQKSLAPMCDELDLVLVVPQMPWFAKPGKVPASGVLQSLDQLRRELQSRFHLETNLVIVSGVSAGARTACDLAERWKPDVQLLVIHSGRSCDERATVRSVELAGEKEGYDPNDERQGNLYGVPGEAHEPHIRYMAIGLQTEVAGWWLQHLGTSRADAAGKWRGLLQTELPATDAFLRAQNARRHELLEKFR